MGIVSGLVLYACIWFLVLFIVLPLRLETQGDRGEVTPGTQKGAPVDPQMKRRALIVTGVAAVIWVIIAGIILSGVIEVRDFDWFNRMGPAPTDDRGG